jgi:hypothetical protein
MPNILMRLRANCGNEALVKTREKAVEAVESSISGNEVHNNFINGGHLSQLKKRLADAGTDSLSSHGSYARPDAPADSGSTPQNAKSGIAYRSGTEPDRTGPASAIGAETRARATYSHRAR